MSIYQSHDVRHSALGKVWRRHNILPDSEAGPRETLFPTTTSRASSLLKTTTAFTLVARKGIMPAMDKARLRSVHADPPGRLDPPADSNGEEPEREVHSNGEPNDERLKQYEVELQHRWEAIVALRDVVMKQRATIHSLKAERRGMEPTFPLEEIREEVISKTSTLSGSDSSEESESIEEADRKSSPTVTFDPSHGDKDDEDEMSPITCEEEDSSIDSSDFLKMEYHKQVVLESAKAQAACPVDTVISFDMSKASVNEPREPVSTNGIKGAIESIQEQASHLDAAIALDRLQTAKNELESATIDLRNRTAEVGELKNQVKVLECQIATLELERDLHVSTVVLVKVSGAAAACNSQLSLP